MTARGQTMLRYAAVIATFIGCSALLIWAQQAAQVAYFEQVHIKSGEVEKYETTLKRHWTWHEKQGETWSYFVWSVDTGKNEGAYQVASLGHSWKEVDESNALVAGTPGPEEDPEPYEQAVEESYYRYRPDLSIGSPTQQPLPVASVSRILVKPEAVQAFEVALQQIKRVLPTADRSVSLSSQWYELVTGGDRPQFLLIEERPNWDGFDGNGELDALKSEIEKTKISEETVKTFWSSVRTIYAETWHYRADLSRLRKSK
jgi:hypothetical protein